MIASLLALNRKSIDSKQTSDTTGGEESKIEALPMGDLSNLPTKEDAEHAETALKKENEAESGSAKKEAACEDKLLEAIKTLERPLRIDPLIKHDFDSFIVENFKRQRTTSIIKKNPSAPSKAGGFAPSEGPDTPRN